MEHVVYTQVYLEDVSKYRRNERVFAEVFPKTPPARAVLGVAASPGAAIQINAVAVRSLADRRAIYPQDYKSRRVGFAWDSYSRPAFRFRHAWQRSCQRQIPDDPAAQVDFALDRMKAVLEAAGLELGTWFSSIPT